MKRIILTIIILLLLFGTISLAQNTELPSPGITPDSLFYFLDTLAERIGMFFTFGAEKKAEKAIKYAEEKLAEVKAMAERNKVKALEKANQKYQEYLGLANKRVQEAKEKGKDVEELAILITEKILKHQEILVEVFEKVPEEAKMAIEKAIEVSRKGLEEAVQAVTGAKKEELQQKIEEALIIPVNWKAYRNEKYGYFFKYPPDCFYGPMPVYCKEKPPEERPPECLCFLNSEDPDRVFLQAFTGEKDSLTLADFSVSHYETSWYNPPPDTDLIKWLKEKFSDLHEDIPDKPNMEIDGIPAVKIYTPSSPMAFSGEGIYFIRNDMLFMVSMLDVDSESNKELYNQILSTFKFVELEEAKEEAPEVEEKPYIKVISPNGGEEWKVGNTYNITWASKGVEKVNIFLLGCKTKECPVESGISSYKIYPHSLDAEAGKYSWTIYSKDIGFGFGFGISEYACFKIKIEEASSESVGILDKFLSMLAYISNKLGAQTPDLVEDVSDECFTIIEAVLPEEPPEEEEKEEVCNVPETPKILTEPGISVNNNEPYTLNWTSVEGATGYWYQSGYGAPVFDAPAVYTKLNSITRTPHLGTSVTFYYRVKACNDCGCSTWSNIVDIQVIVAPFIRITSPNGGERWVVGQAYNIKWQSYRLEKVTIDLFAYNAEGQVIKGFQYFIAESVDATKLYYNWTIPEIGDYPNYKLRIYNKLCIGGDRDLLAECLKDQYFDESDNFFSIVSPSITVTSPNGGEEWERNNRTDSDTCSILTCKEIKWSGGSGTSFTSVDAYLEQFKNNQFTVVGKIPAYGYGSISWPVGIVVPTSCTNPWYPDLYQCSKWLVDPGEYYVRLVDRKTGVQDRSDAPFSIMSNPSITVITPNGGDVWVEGKTYSIQWISGNLPTGNNIDIELIGVTETGNTVRKTLFSSLPNNSTNINWLVPVDIKGRYRIRVISYAFVCGGNQSTCLDDSDAPFSIVQPSITLTSPNGGEVWAENVTHRIKWDTARVDPVWIKYLVEYTDGSSEVFSVVQDAKNLGYYDWNIPDLSTKFEYKYKIGVGDSEAILDWSDDYFQIGPSPPPEP